MLVAKGNIKQRKEEGLSLRRNLLSIPEVQNALIGIEKDIFLCTTKRRLAAIPDDELVRTLKDMIDYIGKDIGIKSEILPYDKTRFFQILRRYYNDLTLDEIKIAFELSLVGELDEYLPKSNDGKADRNHYQQFSIEYACKILNAYKNRKKRIIHKAILSLPEQENKINEAEKQYYQQKLYSSIIAHFLKYKETGRFDTNVDEFVYYEVLESRGLAIGVEVSDEERKQALQRLLRKVRRGFYNEFLGDCLMAQKENHSLVPIEAHKIARGKALKATYDDMIKNKIEIKDYLK